MKETQKLKADYEKLSLADDFMFCKIMVKPKNCIEMLQRLTGNKIERIKAVAEQKVIQVTSDSKGIRYDVYVEDNNNIVYDAEMQRKRSEKETGIEILSKRVRAYQGLMDVNLLEKGGSYKELKNSYVIFICTFDPFGRNLCCYEFENICKDVEELKLLDGRKILFFNTKGTIKNISPEAEVFLDYIEKKKVGDRYTESLEKQVKMARMNKEWRVEYMKTYFHDIDVRDEGREEGIEQGKIIQLIELVRDGDLSIEVAIKKSNLSKEEFMKYFNGESNEQ